MNFEIIKIEDDRIFLLNLRLDSEDEDFSYHCVDIYNKIFKNFSNKRLIFKDFKNNPLLPSVCSDNHWNNFWYEIKKCNNSEMFIIINYKEKIPAESESVRFPHSSFL